MQLNFMFRAAAASEVDAVETTVKSGHPQSEQMLSAFPRQQTVVADIRD
jgi:hypothetical protein